MSDPVGRLLVAGQFLLIFYLLLSSHWQDITVLAVLILGSALLLAGWSFSALRPGSFNIRPELKKGANLVTCGPYRYVRNPMYSSVLLAACGVLVLNCSVWRGLAFIMLVAILGLKIYLEEQLLHQFASYQQYCRQAGRFIPKIRGFWL